MTSIAISHSAPLNSTVSNRDQLFQELVSQFADDIYRYAYWLSNDKQAAEDVSQETLLRAWKSIHKLQDSKATKGWLLTIARRENARRFERKQLEMVDYPTEQVCETHPDYDTTTEAYVLRNALKKLPLEYREPLLLQVEFGFSQKEVAQHLGITTAGAGTRLFRARQKLREIIED